MSKPQRIRRGMGAAPGATVTMPPVQLISDLAPVDHPQYMPPTPHRLPPLSQRPVRRIADGLFLSDLPAGVVPTAPPMGDASATFEPHRYALIIEGTYAAPAAASGIPFLLQPTAKRNFLGLRNTQAAGGDTIYLGFGRDASTLSWLSLLPTEIVLFDTVVPQNDLYAISTTGVGVLAYAYGTFVPSE